MALLKRFPILVFALLALTTFATSCKEASKKEGNADDVAEKDMVSETASGGLALYTVRDAMGEDPKGTLAEVATVGYANIEAAGYNEGTFYGMVPAEFKSYLDSVGLNPVSTHQGGVTLENADAMIADVKAAGFKYFVVPVPPMGMLKFDPATRKLSMEGTAEELAQILETLGQKCKEAGLELLYHNHDFELIANEDGVVVLDYLLENLDPELVNFQMDLYWMTVAGADPLAYFEAHPGRFKAWHVKDMDDQGRFAPVGEGTIDFGRILDQKDRAGMEFYFVEQDMTFDGLEPLDAIKISKEGISKIGFE